MITKGKMLWSFLQIFSTNCLMKYVEISLENLYLDIADNIWIIRDTMKSPASSTIQLVDTALSFMYNFYLNLSMLKRPPA